MKLLEVQLKVSLHYLLNKGSCSSKFVTSLGVLHNILKPWAKFSDGYKGCSFDCTKIAFLIKNNRKKGRDFEKWKMSHKEYQSIYVQVTRMLYTCVLSPFAFQEYHLYVPHGYKRLNSQLFCYVEQKSLQHCSTLQKKKKVNVKMLVVSSTEQLLQESM